MSYKKYVSFSSDGQFDTYSHEAINTADVSDSWMLADYSYIQKILRQLTGEVLTIIDASIGDSRQNKAIKDLIKNIFAEKFLTIGSELTPEPDKMEWPTDVPVTAISTDELLEVNK